MLNKGMIKNSNVTHCFSFLLVGLLRALEHQIGENAEDKRACGGGEGDLTEGQYESADTCNEDNRNGKEILVLGEVNLLYHLKTRNCDKSVESYADTAHYARGDRVNEGNEGSEEGDKDRADRGVDDGPYRRVAADSYTTDRLTVGGVGTSAKECARERSNTVAKKCVGEAGLLEEILLDDSGEVLVVSDMLSENNECNGSVRDDYCSKVGKIEILKAAESVYKGELMRELWRFPCIFSLFATMPTAQLL